MTDSTPDPDSEDTHQTPSNQPAPSFFADATLDLAEAHDIADTPEASKPPLETSANHHNFSTLSVPNLSPSTAPNLATTMEETTSAQFFTNDIANTTTSPHPASHELLVDDPHGFIDDDDDDNEPNNNNNKQSFSRISGTHLHQPIPPNRPRRPRWPRDVSWSISFWLCVPTLLVWYASRPFHTTFAQHPSSFGSLHSITYTIVFCLLSSRWLYYSPGGSEGDYIRQRVARHMVLLAPTSSVVYVLLGLFVLWQLPSVRLLCVVPFGYSLRDCYSFRRWNRSSALAGNYASRTASFQAHLCMAVDILSRSLRRASLYRVLFGLTAVQILVLLLWRWALFGAISSTHSVWSVGIVLILGKWATATITRVLTYLASAGVMLWCSAQAGGDAAPANGTNGGNVEFHSTISVGAVSDDEDTNGLPAAYATVDASVYQSVLVEDVLDDDSVDEQELETAPSRVSQSEHAPRLTVKHILLTGLWTHFGSMAHCGLLGGLAQFVWSQLRRLEDIQSGNGSNGGRTTNDNDRFRAIPIGDSATLSASSTTVSRRVRHYARSFVRNHSDLAMCHVSLYHKGYVRAARDVLQIIETSNMEPILHEDITTHMCTSIAASITGVIVLLSSWLLVHQKKSYPEVTDWHVIQNMLLSFILSYTLIFTVMEPLRAAIKAVYVSFAQQPRCLAQAYPLIYHRLTRLSESRIS